MSKLFSQPLVVLDTETTGFGAWARVTEIGAVLLDVDGKELASFATLMRPEILDERADMALKITGITRAMLASAPSTEEARQLWQEWHVQRWGSDGLGAYVTAFNTPFDKRMLLQSGFPELRWARCVMRRAAPVVKGRPSSRVSLAKAVQHFGVVFEGQAHRALADARAAGEVAVAVQRLELQGGK